MPYVGPVILWLVGFFPIMAFVGSGKLSVLTGLVSVGYISLLPTFLLGALFYNFVVRPKKYRKWEATFMCQRCGGLTEPQPIAPFAWQPVDVRGAGAQREDRLVGVHLAFPSKEIISNPGMIRPLMPCIVRRMRALTRGITVDPDEDLGEEIPL
jgi:hypothetical protein